VVAAQDRIVKGEDVTPSMDLGDQARSGQGCTSRLDS
jgi:hypothetical protein